jgi:6-pyruvoyl tetrahydropterin synthase
LGSGSVRSLAFVGQAVTNRIANATNVLDLGLQRPAVLANSNLGDCPVPGEPFCTTIGECLNEIEGLENPTAENIAIWIWERVKSGLPQLASIRIYETNDSWVEYDGC